MNDTNPVLVYLAELSAKADMIYVAKGKRSVALYNCGDEETARFIIDRLRERYIKP